LISKESVIALSKQSYYFTIKGNIVWAEMHRACLFIVEGWAYWCATRNVFGKLGESERLHSQLECGHCGNSCSFDRVFRSNSSTDKKIAESISQRV